VPEIVKGVGVFNATEAEDRHRDPFVEPKILK
jgi:hypothetical protein